MKDIKNDPFDEYIKNLPPTRRELGQAWAAAIGLQDVDGLKPSEYLYETARKNKEGVSLRYMKRQNFWRNFYDVCFLMKNTNCITERCISAENFYWVMMT